MAFFKKSKAKKDQFFKNGRYKVIDHIYNGGQGTTYKALDTQTYELVAIKQIRIFGADETDLLRAEFEAKNLRDLKHKNIIEFRDCFKTNDAIYIVTKFLEGKTLADILEKQKTIDEKRTLIYIKQVAKGIKYLTNKKIVHRDIKPANVIIGENNKLTIVDFGISKTFIDDNLTKTDNLPGTAHYISPEVAKGGKASWKSDTWALGILAYQCLEGRRPFDDKDKPPMVVLRMHIEQEPKKLSSKHSKEMQILLDRMLNFDPEQRFSSPDILIQAIEQVERKLFPATPATSDTVRFDSQTKKYVRHSSNPRSTITINSASLQSNRYKLKKLNKAIIIALWISVFLGIVIAVLITIILVSILV